eukprot:14561052-Alexandrium_andersonii.AAC.1
MQSCSDCQFGCSASCHSSVRVVVVSAGCGLGHAVAGFIFNWSAPGHVLRSRMTGMIVACACCCCNSACGLFVHRVGWRHAGVGLMRH